MRWETNSDVGEMLGAWHWTETPLKKFELVPLQNNKYQPHFSTPFLQVAIIATMEEKHVSHFCHCRHVSESWKPNDERSVACLIPRAKWKNIHLTEKLLVPITLSDCFFPMPLVTPLHHARNTLAALSALIACFHARNQQITDAMVTDLGAVPEPSNKDWATKLNTKLCLI